MKTVMFNPYTGTPRHPSDIASDPSGLLILEPGAPLRAAAQVVALEPEGPDGHGVNWLAGKRPKPGDLLFGGDAVARALAAKNEADTNALKAAQEADELRAALESVWQYGSDTLSGRTDGPDDRDWQRAAVLEMTRRARLALGQAPAAQSVQPALTGIRDLRDAKWLDPQCADKGACQSLLFKATQAEPWHNPRAEKLREALKDIAETKNVTATSQQFARALQRIACDALTEDAMAEPATDPAVEKAWARFCLENCRLYAARHRKEEWAKTILRFCDEAGVKCSPLRSALNAARDDELRAAQEAETRRWEEAMRMTWQMVDPLKPAGTPGSYARGQDSGIVAALTTLRANLKPPN